MKFLQVSDIHLGSRIRLSWLSSEARQSLQECVREAFRKAMQAAVDRQVDAVLIPGDLFDDESVSNNDVAWAVSCFRMLGALPVYITPGNHDPFWPGSPYHPLYSASHRQLSWPDNVHIFNSDRWETIVSKDGSFSVTGIAHTHAGEIRDRKLSQKAPLGDAPVKIMMLHGSREAPNAPDIPKTLPFTDQEAANQNAHWIAAGHYHSSLNIVSGGYVIGGYSGCPQGRGLDEAGKRNILIGDINPEGGCRVEKISSALRTIELVDLVITDLGPAEVTDRIVKALAACGSDAICYIRLTGRPAPDFRLEVSATATAGLVGEYYIDSSQLSAPYDLDDILQNQDQETLPSRFVRRMLELKNNAMSDDAAEYEAALTLGLDAIYGKPVKIPHVH